MKWANYPLTTQVTTLTRIGEQGNSIKVGSSQVPKKQTLRIVAATNCKNAGLAIQKGKFREDLVLPSKHQLKFNLPPLRDTQRRHSLII